MLWSALAEQVCEANRTPQLIAEGCSVYFDGDGDNGSKPESAVLFANHSANGGFRIKELPMKIARILARP